MRSAGLILVSLFLPVGLAAQAPDTAAREITLDEAVQLAQRNAPAAVEARGQMRTSQAAVRSAYASFIPNISVTAGGNRQLPAEPGRIVVRDIGGIPDSVRLPNNPWSYSNRLSASVTLFEGGRRLHNVRSARANVGAAEANETAQRFRVALEVQQQYFNALAARESEAAALAQLEQAQLQLRAASARVAAGNATRSDSLRAVIQVGNAQLAVLTARNSLRSANAGLTRLVATPFPVTASASDTLPTRTSVDSAELARLAATGPAVTQAEANLAAVRAAQRAARAPYLPQINMNYGYSGNGPDRFGFGNDPYSYQGALSFSISYPIFNQLAREEGVIRADVNRESAEAQLRDAAFAARQSLVQYLGQLRTAEQRIAIQQASVDAAEEDLRVQQQRYAVGASTQLDVLTSQTQLNQARSDLIQARYDYRVARAQIEALIGRELR